MNKKSTLPRELQNMLASYMPTENKIGLSGAAVYCYRGVNDTLYLKIQKTDEEIQREHAVLHWAADKLPVPEVRFYREQEGMSYLLMTAVKGYMSFMDTGGKLFTEHAASVSALAEGLRLLQVVDIQDCPFDSRLGIKLEKARRRVEQGLVDVNDFQEDSPFTTAEALYTYLSENRPDEELCFTHGDYCLPNVFIEGERLTGFIDMGRAGVADKWQDIALCVRSLKYNLEGVPDRKKECCVNLLFEQLGMAANEEKIQYYILLDDLF